jgi:hypothetical protein
MLFSFQISPLTTLTLCRGRQVARELQVGKIWCRSISLPLVYMISTLLIKMCLPDDIISINRGIDAGSLLLAVQSLLAINTGYIIYHTVDVKILLLDQELFQSSEGAVGLSFVSTTVHPIIITRHLKLRKKKPFSNQVPTSDRTLQALMRYWYSG